MLRTLFTLLVTSCALFAGWPQDASDLKPDPKAIFGSLENGLRYLVLPHDEPPGRASIRLYMDVGSLMEEATRGSTSVRLAAAGGLRAR